MEDRPHEPAVAVAQAVYPAVKALPGRQISTSESESLMFNWQDSAMQDEAGDTKVVSTSAFPPSTRSEATSAGQHAALKTIRHTLLATCESLQLDVAMLFTKNSLEKELICQRPSAAGASPLSPHSDPLRSLAMTMATRARQQRKVLWFAADDASSAPLLRSVPGIGFALAVPSLVPSADDGGGGVALDCIVAFRAHPSPVRRNPATEKFLQCAADMVATARLIGSLHDSASRGSAGDAKAGDAMPDTSTGSFGDLVYAGRDASRMSSSRHSGGSGSGRGENRTAGVGQTATVAPMSDGSASGGSGRPSGMGAAPAAEPEQIQWGQMTNIQQFKPGTGCVLCTASLHGKSVVAKLQVPTSGDERAIQELRAEIAMLRTMQHENIVSLVAFGSVPRDFLVLELLEGGTLEDVTANAGRAARSGGGGSSGGGGGGGGGSSGGGWTPPWRKSTKASTAAPSARGGGDDSTPLLLVLMRAKQLAAALRHIHQEIDTGSVVIHRDIKPSNIGLTADGTLKLIDFGLATRIPRGAAGETYKLTGKTGTQRYMAPEVALNRRYNERVDVYSFALIVWEMASLTKPFAGMNVPEHCAQVCQGGMRPSLQRAWPKPLTDLVTACWNGDQMRRPSMDVVVDEVQAQLEALGTDGVDRRTSLKSLKDRQSTWF